jgi:hypothetical protein
LSPKEDTTMGVETEKRQRTPARRRWLLLSVLGAINLVALGLVATPSQAQVITCSSTLSNQTIAASVVVQSGMACQLVNVEVSGRVDVQSGADLFLESSRIRGPLAGAASSFVSANDSRVDGMTTMTQSFGLYSTSSRFDRLVDIRNGGFVYSDDSTHWGGILSSGGETVIENGVVLGSVSTSGDQLTDLFDTAVFGPVSVTNATYGSVMCHMGAALSVNVRTSAGVVQIGSAGPTTGCGFNLLGSLGIFDNVGADIQITGNFIAGNLSCTGNNPAPFGASNLVGGSRTGQCASLSPKPASSSIESDIEATSGIQQTSTAPRTSHILSLIAQRTA